MTLKSNLASKCSFYMNVILLVLINYNSNKMNRVNRISIVKAKAKAKESDDRKKSFFYNMRRYHNYIKRQLIETFAYKADSLLDLASGKGGDLQKWIDNKIRRVDGYDIHEPSVMEARRRLLDARTQAQNISVTFTVKDLSRDVLPKNENGQYDVVTSMFAFHYFFKSYETLDTIITTIDNNLKVDGIFVCCLFDGSRVEDKINKGFLGDKFNVRHKDHKDRKDVGNRIGVLLKDTVLDDETDEYIVDYNFFVNIMKKRGYDLIETKTFDEQYEAWEKNQKGYMNKFEKEVSFLNRYYVFKKSYDFLDRVSCLHQVIRERLTIV